MINKKLKKASGISVILLISLLFFIFNDNIQSQYFIWKTHYNNEKDVIQTYFWGVNHHHPKVVQSTLHPKLTVSHHDFQYKEVESWKIIRLFKNEEKTEYFKKEMVLTKQYGFTSPPFDAAVYEVEFDLKVNPYLDYSKTEIDSTFLDLEGKGRVGIYLIKETNSSPWKIIDFAFGPI